LGNVDDNDNGNDNNGNDNNDNDNNDNDTDNNNKKELASYMYRVKIQK